MPTMWDMIAESILKQAGPLVDDLLPKIKDIVYDQTMRALRDYYQVVTPGYYGENTGSIEPSPTNEPLIICDLATLPEQMRADGIMLKDNAIYYGVACAWAGHGWTHNEETAPIIALSDRIQGWFESYIQKAIRKLQTNPGLTAVAIANDGRDRCGFIIGPVLMERFGGFGNRVTLGADYPGK